MLAPVRPGFRCGSLRPRFTEPYLEVTRGTVLSAGRHATGAWSLPGGGAATIDSVPELWFRDTEGHEQHVRGGPIVAARPGHEVALAWGTGGYLQGSANLTAGTWEVHRDADVTRHPFWSDWRGRGGITIFGGLAIFLFGLMPLTIALNGLFSRFDVISGQGWVLVAAAAAGIGWWIGGHVEARARQGYRERLAYLRIALWDTFEEPAGASKADPPNLARTRPKVPVDTAGSG